VLAAAKVVTVVLVPVFYAIAVLRLELVKWEREANHRGARDS
jgi:hypothetical protein